MKKTLTSNIETIAFGKQLASQLTGGDIVLLHGDLGAGKTTMTKGIASYFGIEEIVSPTFTLMNIYDIKCQMSNVKCLVHIDTYRLEDERQLVEIGIEDYLGDKDTICIIEWPEKIKDLLAKYHVHNVEITHIDDGREVTHTVGAKMISYAPGESKSLALCKKFLGKKLEIKIDQAAGTMYKGTKYEINYGFVPGTQAPDGDNLDAYFLDSIEPLEEAQGTCIGIVHRLEDDDDKLLVSNQTYTKEEIEKKVHFAEQHFKHEIILAD